MANATWSFSQTGATSSVATSAGSSTAATVLSGSDCDTVLVQNSGAATIFVKFGTSTVQAAATDTPVLANQSMYIDVYGLGITHFAVYSGTGSITVYATRGRGEQVDTQTVGGGGGGLDASDVRAEVESELIAGSGVTLTGSGAGANRQVTVAAKASTSPAIVNLRDYGVTTSSDPLWNSQQIQQAISDAGQGGTVVIPSYGVGNYIQHRGIVVRESALSIIGESPIEMEPTYGSNLGCMLKCIDATVPGMFIDAGYGLQNITVKGIGFDGGYDAFRIGSSGGAAPHATGYSAGGGLINNCSFKNLRFSGMKRAGLCIESTAVEECWFDSIAFNGNNLNTIGLYINGVYSDTYFAVCRFSHLWSATTGSFAMLIDCPKWYTGWVDCSFDMFRANNTLGAAFAVRGGGSGVQFNELTCESTCTGLSSGARVDFIFDGTKAGFPYAAAGTKRITNFSPFNFGYIPILARSDLLISDTGWTTGITNSVGVIIDETREFPIAGSTSPWGATMAHTDPGVAVYGALDATTMKVFDMWPMQVGIRASNDVAIYLETAVLPGMCSPDCFSMNDYECDSYVNAMI